jgi:hypothetical protein
MASKTRDLTWQSDYATQYLRTAGQPMSFSPAGPGGIYTVTTGDATRARKNRMRKSECVAATARLRERPDFVESPKP